MNMMNGEFYTNVLKTKEVVSEFQDNLVITNRSYDFFVNWKKIKGNIEKLRIEFSILEGVIGSKNIERDLKKLIKEYPEVLKAFPILFATRDLNLTVVEDFNEIKHNFSAFDFNKDKGDKLTEEEIEQYVRFAKNTGIIHLFETNKNIKDYAFGVEVGMDTNARKNRSGLAMELMIYPLLKELSKKYGFDIRFQKKFKIIETDFRAKIPPELRERKADFILHKNGNFVNIEVNYYGGGGSKPEEIVDSYINRYNELKANGWYFIWITDGMDCWNGATNQLVKAFNHMDYILNIYFIRKGLLEKAIIDILEQKG